MLIKHDNILQCIDKYYVTYKFFLKVTNIKSMIDTYSIHKNDSLMKWIKFKIIYISNSWYLILYTFHNYILMNLFSAVVFLEIITIICLWRGFIFKTFMDLNKRYVLYLFENYLQMNQLEILPRHPSRKKISVNTPQIQR